jgi:hypothetical protein
MEGRDVQGIQKRRERGIRRGGRSKDEQDKGG